MIVGAGFCPSIHIISGLCASKNLQLEMQRINLSTPWPFLIPDRFQVMEKTHLKGHEKYHPQKGF